IRDPCRRHVAGRVGADGQKHGVPERQQTRVAEQQIETEQRDRVSHRGEHQDYVVGSRDEGEKENNQKQQSRQRQSPFRSSCGGGPGGDRCGGVCHAAPARRPGGGRMIRFMTMTKRASSSNSGKSHTAGDRTTPTRSAPIGGRGMLPTPPIMTTAKAS